MNNDCGPAAVGVVSLPVQALWSAVCQPRGGAAPRTLVASGLYCLLAVSMVAPPGLGRMSGVAAATGSSLGNLSAARQMWEHVRAVVV